MAGPDRGEAASPSGGIARLSTVAKMPLPGPLGAQDPLQLPHPLGSPQAGERQRAPGDAQRDAEGRLVGPVPGDVADHHVHGAVRRLHEVVEVAAQQRVLPAGPVLGDDVDTRVVQQQRRRQQPAFQPGVLPGPQLGWRAARPRSARRACARSRSSTRAPQHFGLDPALDQVVLRARGDRRDPEVLVVEAGQHDDRDGRVALGDPVERRRSRRRRAGCRSSRTQSGRAAAISRSASAIDCAQTTRMSTPASAISSSTSTASARSSSTSSSDNVSPSLGTRMCPGTLVGGRPWRTPIPSIDNFSTISWAARGAVNVPARRCGPPSRR